MIKFKKIRSLLQLILGALVVMVIAALGFVHYQSVKDSLFREYREKQLNTVLIASQSYFYATLEKALETSELLAEDPTINLWFTTEEKNEEYKQLTLERLHYLRNNYDYATVFAVNYKTKHYWRENYELLDVLSEDDPDDNWFFHTIDNKIKSSLNYDHNRELKSTILFINVLMGDPNHPIGVAGVGIDPSVLITAFNEHKPTKNSRIWLIDKNGMVIMSTNINEINHPLEKHLPSYIIQDVLSTRKPSVISERKINGEDVELAFMPIGKTRYKIIMLVPDNDLFPVLSLIKNQTFLFSFLFLLITLGVVKFLALGISQPLTSLIRWSEKVAVGELGVSPDVRLLNRTDELGRLAKSFDTMKVQLSQVIEKVKQTNFNLEAEQKQLKLTNEELNKALVKASESERLTQSFLANISHEIRTPMNSILGFSQLLEVSELDTLEHKKYASLVLKGGQQLLSILDSIINLSKIESGIVKPHWQNINVHQLLKETFDLYEVLATQANLRMAIETNDIKNDAIIDSDPVLIQHVLNNLVSNALKYTPQGSIIIGCKRGGDNVIYYVSDTGVGVPKEDHEFIFEPFRQVENSHFKKSDGAGLGLAIVSKIVNILGGHIYLKSEVDVGSTFSIELPVVSKQLIRF